MCDMLLQPAGVRFLREGPSLSVLRGILNMPGTFLQDLPMFNDMQTLKAKKECSKKSLI